MLNKIINKDTNFMMKTIIANPPFSVNWTPEDKYNKDQRFSEYGKLAPKSKADYAFIQDMIYHLDEHGIMTVVLPHGVLFRGSAEGHIRRHLIQKMNVLDAVIGLPENLFFGTSIPTCILIFRKNRKSDDDILFIDASKDFVKVKNKNTISNEQLSKIVKTYKERSVTDRYSSCAKIKEVIENDYNLNIPRYVDTFQEEEPIDIDATMIELNKLKLDSIEQDKKINEFLKELGLPLFI